MPAPTATEPCTSRLRPASTLLPVAWCLATLLSVPAALAQPVEDGDSAGAAPEPVDVVIVGKRKARPHDTAAVSEVAGDRLRDSSRPSTFEAIAQETPGLFSTSRGVGFHGVASGASGALHIRGLGGSPNTQVLVVEDGVPDYQGLFGHPIPDAYAPFLIDRVRVIRGGDSVLYGTNALGGVILIRNRRRALPGWELHNDVAYGSYNTLRERIAALALEGPVDATASFSALQSDGHRAGAGGNNTVAQVSTRWRPEPATSLTLSHKRFRGTGADPGPVTHPTPDHTYDVVRSSTSLQLVSSQRGVLLRMAPYVNLGTHRLYDGFYSEDRTAGAYAQVELDLVEEVRMLAGAAADSVSGIVENRATLERENVHGLANVAGYGQLAWMPSRIVEVVAGGRSVFNNEYGVVPLYKLGVRVEPWNEINLHGRVARNFRQPTLRERYLPFPTANPDLRPEYATTWDLGVSARRAPIQAEVVGFYTHADDLIRYFGAFPTAEVVNIDSYDVWGVEGSLAIVDAGPVSARMHATWQDVGRYTKQNPSHQAGFTIGSKHPAGGGTLALQVSGQWVAGLYQNNYERDPIDDVFFVDASVRWKRELPERSLCLEPYLILRNLLDLEYAYIEGYRMPRTQSTRRPGDDAVSKHASPREVAFAGVFGARRAASAHPLSHDPAGQGLHAHVPAPRCSRLFSCGPGHPRRPQLSSCLCSAPC